MLRGRREGIGDSRRMSRYSKWQCTNMLITLDFVQNPRVGMEIVLMRNEVINCCEAQARTKYPGNLPCLPFRVQVNSEPRSRCRAIVVLEQSAEDALAFHSAEVRFDQNWLLQQTDRQSIAMVNDPNAVGGLFSHHAKPPSRPRQPRFPVLLRSLVNSFTGRTSRFSALWLTGKYDTRHPNSALAF